MEARNKIERKCFLSVPVIHEPSNLAHVSPSYPIHTCRLSADHPRIIRPPNNRQAQGHYVTDEQCIHTPANMIIHCLRNNYTMLPIHYTLKTLLRTFPCGWNLKIVIYINTPVLVWSRKLSEFNSDLYQYTRSRLITEVKHRRAWIVLGWGCIPS